MKFVVLAIGKGREKWVKLACDHYLDRVRRFMPAELAVLRPSDYRGQVDRCCQDEGARVTELLRDGDFLVVLDERGQHIDTDQWVRLVEQAARQSAHRMVFVVGGPYGHGDALRARADKVVALSALVLNHQIALVVVIEQLYRVASLMKGAPYHHR